MPPIPAQPDANLWAEQAGVLGLVIASLFGLLVFAVWVIYWIARQQAGLVGDIVKEILSRKKPKE